MPMFNGDGSWEDWCTSGYGDRDNALPVSSCVRCGKLLYDEIPEFEDDCGNPLCEECFFQMKEQEE